MIKFIAHQETLPNTGGTIQDLKDNLPVMANNSAAEQIAERLQDKYGHLACVDHPDTEIEVIIRLELGFNGENKNIEFIPSNQCCEAFGPTLNEQLENMSLVD